MDHHDDKGGALPALLDRIRDAVCPVYSVGKEHFQRIVCEWASTHVGALTAGDSNHRLFSPLATQNAIQCASCWLACLLKWSFSFKSGCRLIQETPSFIAAIVGQTAITT